MRPRAYQPLPEGCSGANLVLYRRGKKGIWYSGYPLPEGGYRYESTRSTNKRLAQKLEGIRYAEVAEVRFHLPRSNPPKLQPWSDQFLESIPNKVTQARYTTSVRALLKHFRGVRLPQLTTEGIEEFKRARIKAGVGPASVNRDLAVLRRMMKMAKRQRLITQNPVDEVEFLEERKHRRQPHILTLEEEQRLLAVASPMLKTLVILLLETGLRVGKEALTLKWRDIDILNGAVHIRESKTLAGRRMVPLSAYCKDELIRWRNLAGSEYSCYVFPSLKKPLVHIGSVKKAWASTLKAAGIDFFPIYNLRATFASRLSAAGEPDVLVAQMIGHSYAGILQTYAKAIDEYRRQAIQKLEIFRRTMEEQLKLTRIDSPCKTLTN